MDDYKPNSYKSKENSPNSTHKKVEKVVIGPVKVQKKTEANKVRDLFISKDAGNLKNYAVMEVLVPALKKAISDIVKNGIEMILYGETSRERNRSSVGSISYNRYYDPRDREFSGYRPEPRARSSIYDYSNVSFTTKGDAEVVLSRLEDMLNDYPSVSVADFYELIEVTGEYTDNNYGWTNLRMADVIHARDGWIIRFPPIQALM